MKNDKKLKMVQTKINQPPAVHLDPKSRRMFLKSAGGLTLALPLLPSLLTTASETALAATEAPLRYVGIVNHLGGLQNKNWFGTNLPTSPFDMYPGRVGKLGSLASLAGPGGLSPVLDASFNSLLPYSNIVAGVDSPGTDGHNNWVAMGAFSDQNYPKPGITGNFPSVDQVLAFSGAKQKGIYGSTLSGRRRTLNIGTLYSGAAWTKDDYTANDPVRYGDSIISNSGIFSYLFGNVDPTQMQNGTPTSNPLINLVNEFWPSGRAILKFLSKQDRDSVEQLFSLAQDASDDFSFPPPVINIAGKPVGTDSNYDTPAGQNALADIISMAFQCDITRIVTMWVGHTVNGLNWHGMTHAPESGNGDSGQPELVQIHQNFAKNIVARLGTNLLAADPFGSGTSMLNNSLITWTSENKCAHITSGLPLLMMGAAGGRIKTGNFADLRDLTSGYETDYVGDQRYRGDIINRLWASIFYAMNIPRSNYEVARGGVGTLSMPLDKGWGHLFYSPKTGYGQLPTYNASKVGEPWEFLTKPTTTWG